LIEEVLPMLPKPVVVLVFGVFLLGGCEPCPDSGVIPAQGQGPVAPLYGSAPEGGSAEATFTFHGLAPAQNSVGLRFESRADLGGHEEWLTVFVGTTDVGKVFASSDTAEPCAVRTDGLSVPASVFNGALDGTSLTVRLVPSQSVDGDVCFGATSAAVNSYACN
jgi:hypothetical protein